MKVHFETLAYIITQDKNAGAVMAMVMPKFEERSLYISPTQIEDATGIKRSNVSRAIRWLVGEGYLVEDPEGTNLYYISNRLVYTNIHDTYNSNKIKTFPSLGVPLTSRRQMREVEAMNKLSDEDVANEGWEVA